LTGRTRRLLSWSKRWAEFGGCGRRSSVRRGLRVMKRCAKLWRMKCREGEQEERCSLGHVFAKSVVQDESVVSTLIRGYLINAMRNLVCFAPSNPAHLLQPNARQLLHDSRRRVRRGSLIFRSLNCVRIWRRRNRRIGRR